MEPGQHRFFLVMGRVLMSYTLMVKERVGGSDRAVETGER